MSKKEELDKILLDLKATGDVLGASVVSKDGLVIASDISGTNPETFAAMSAAMAGAAETAAAELKQGGVNQIIVDAKKGKLVTINAGENALLVVIATPDVNLGLLLLEMGKASGRIISVLEG
ncbi:MAG: roadblock/LC7 domain-containing protein [Nanoarchaeota archaeon]|nr:roadblock/LC7 domain-containing protein [Nanoarchaeota archaeon]